jgi:hypothetical protein
MKNSSFIYRILARTGILFALVSLPLYSTAQAQCVPVNTSFQEGEKLTFRVYYNMRFIWINAGNAEFTTSVEDVANRKAYHITGVGRTASSFEWFYKVLDTYESYIDRQTMLPMRFVRHVSEGSTKFMNDVKFDHKNKQATSENKAFYIPDCTQDVLSAMYFARNINYNGHKPGDKISFDMFLDNQVYSLYVKYLGKEQITTKMGTFNAIRIAPLLIKGTIFKGGDNMTVWLSDDPNHIPVRVESPILIGSVKIDLMEYSNLRNPLSGMISKN